MRAILNPYYEFQIDSTLITYISNGQLLVSDAYNSGVKSSIRSLTKGEDLEIGDLPSGSYWGTPKHLEEALKIGCGCDIEITAVDCSNLRVSGKCNNFWGSEGDGLVTVTFWRYGTQTTATILQEDISGNFDFLIPISTFNGHDGLVTAWVDPDCVLANNKQDVFDFDADDFIECSLKNSTAREYITNGDERMLNETSYYSSPVANYHKSEITSESRINNKWVRSNANMYVEVNANRKDVGCTILDSKEDDKSCPSCKFRSVRVSWTGDCAHCDGDLIGIYQRIKNNVTLNNTQIVPFDCCE